MKFKGRLKWNHHVLYQFQHTEPFQDFPFQYSALAFPYGTEGDDFEGIHKYFLRELLCSVDFSQDKQKRKKGLNFSDE